MTGNGVVQGNPREQAVVILLQEYGLAYGRIQPLLDQLEVLRTMLEAPLDNLRQELRDLVLPGEKFDVPLAEVQMRKGYVRKSWDTRALEGYGEAHPEVLKFRKQSEVGPSLILKAKELPTE